MKVNRRKFLQQTAQAALVFSIVPRFVLGGKGYTPPSEKLTLGFIGVGKQGRGLVKGFANKTPIVWQPPMSISRSSCSLNQLPKSYMQKLPNNPTYKGLDTYTDFRELLNRKDVDAVVIATPDHWHAVGTIMAANAKKHVYCEKPLAHSIQEGRAMVKAVKENKIVLQTGSMQRSRENFRKACELARNGYVGEIKEVLVSVGTAAIPCNLAEQTVPSTLNWDLWLGPAESRTFNAELSPPVEQDIFPNWRLYKEFGGGILSDWGAHMFDIAQWALDKDGSAPVKFFPPNGKEFKTLTMVYDDGIVMKHEDFGRGFGVRFIGTKGSLDISRQFLDSNPANLATAAPEARRNTIVQQHGPSSGLD